MKIKVYNPDSKKEGYYFRLSDNPTDKLWIGKFGGENDGEGAAFCIEDIKKAVFKSLDKFYKENFK